jgi:hypothetical protein
MRLVPALFALLALLLPESASAVGTTTGSFAFGSGGSDHGTFNTLALRYGKLSARERPVQLEFFFGYRQESVRKHTFYELDIGVGGRLLPRRPLAYSGDGKTAIRPTAAASLGFSIASFDLPMEMSAGVAICDNRGASFNGAMVELVARPTNETLSKHSNSVAAPGPGVVDMGPWVGGRLMFFW